MKMKRIAALMIVLLAAPAGMACPFCRDASASAGTTPVFNHSIYFMLGGLFLAACLVVGALSTGFRRRG